MEYWRLLDLLLTGGIWYVVLALSIPFVALVTLIALQP